MMNLDETRFEEHIANVLAHSDLYNQRLSSNFEIADLCDREMLERFVKAQPEVWAKLSRNVPGREIDTVIETYNRAINRGTSIWDMLHKGLMVVGAKVKFVEFQPQIGGEQSSAYRLYRENRFSVVRQMRYSTDAADRDNELDLCILINGIPIITCELKNEGTGQCYEDGIIQYQTNRNAGNRMLNACLVHFVMDNNLVFMTTKLAGADTNFLPFNIGTTNPPVEGDADYPTHYMWDQILQADSLLDILQHFIKRVKDRKGNYTVIFPRFHQLRAVRLLRSLSKEEGPGHNYLVQHSAGSGKTMSMAWLAHELSNLTNDDNTPLFDSIIMVTDRIVLNRNMADEVVAFEMQPGTVKDVRRGSVNLAKAINDGYRIIISTVQKFAFALPNIKKQDNRHFAVIIDEAHTALGKESAKDIISALSSDDDLRQIDDFHPEDYDNQLDALMAYQQVMRKMMHHISYYAFTATPKDTTFALYGKNQHEAHDLYSMKQAIEEGFILDVLENYISYKTMFELVEKDPDEDLKKLFEEKKSLKVIYDSLNKNQYIMFRKASMIVDHFMSHTIKKIGGQAKAMVVTDSRRAAADFKRIIDTIINGQYGGAIKTLVAFSGEVEDSHGRKCTEANMNDGGVKDDDIRLKFEEPEYKILIVAEKFQTGFDQKLLHTMYVDKVLGGIQCIQTLSRLNRCCPGKDDTLVVDFRNDSDVVQKSFQDYYTKTVLNGPVDQTRMYPIKSDIDEYKVFSEEQVNDVVKRLQSAATAIGVPSIMKRIVTDRVEPMEDAEKDRFRKLVNRYIRQYGFIAQVMTFVDPELEKYYVFMKVLYKYLPYTKETLPVDILEHIDLDKLRIQMSFEGQLELEDEEKELSASRIGEPGKKKPDEEMTIKEILHIANEPYAGILDENDKILKQIWESVLVDPEVNEAFRANNTYDNLINLVREKFDEKIAEQIDKYYNFMEILQKNQSFSVALIRRFVDAIAERTYAASRLEYNEEALIAAMSSEMAPMFEPFSRSMRPLEEVSESLLYVLRTPSTGLYDGADDILRDGLNHVFCNPNLTAIDRRTIFNQLLTKYENFLKKLYYLIHQTDVPTNPHAPEDTVPTLSNAIFAFDCLRELKYDTDPAYQTFYGYLSNLKDWRNLESHAAPAATEQELIAGTKVVVAMYLFVTAWSIGDLEEAGY